MRPFVAPMACPCGRSVSVPGRQGGQPLPYAECCGRLHLGVRGEGPFAEDAEALMRSRYSAFVLEDAAYLLATWAPAQRPASLDFESGVKWLGLTIRDAPQSTGSQAEVEFIARYKPPRGGAVRLHERSRFECLDGRWFYVDGVQF